MITKREFEDVIRKDGDIHIFMLRVKTYLETYAKFTSKIPPSTEEFSRHGWINNMFNKGGYLSDLYKVIYKDWFSVSSAYECYTKLESNLKSNLDYATLCANTDSKLLMSLKIASEGIMEIYNSLNAK